MTITINHHHYIHYASHNEVDDVKRLLNSIILKLNNMPTKAEFQAAFDEIGNSLTNVADDITRLTDSLATGGLTDAEEQGVLDQLRSVASTVKSIADRTTEPVVTPPAEGGGGGGGTTETPPGETPVV